MVIGIDIQYARIRKPCCGSYCASSGIGKAIALGLAAQGPTLCLVGRKLETLQSVADAAKGTAPRTHCCQADLAVDHEIQELIANIKRVLNLSTSAGVIWLGPPETANVDQLDGHYKTNLRASFNVLTRAFAFA